MSKKPKLEYTTDEGMAKIDAGHELELDLRAGTQAYDDEYAERIEYLKTRLWDALGLVSQWYPRFDEWDEERKKKFQNYVTWCWHYRNEIRLLRTLAEGRFDVDEQVAEWRFVTDDAFGPLQGTVH